MHKIDAPHATGAGEFTDGDPAMGIEATELWSKWFNTVQRELIAILTAAGITPSAANDAQVIAAIQALIGSHAGATIVHGMTVEVAASRGVVRDGFGRGKFAPGASGLEAIVWDQVFSSAAVRAIAHWGMPRYTAGYAVGSGFVAPRQGWLRLYHGETAFSGQYTQLYINGVVSISFGHGGGGAGHARELRGMVPITGGDSATVASNTNWELVFFPGMGG